MKTWIASLLIGTALATATPALAFKSGNPAAGDGSVTPTQESFAHSMKLLKVMNKNGNYARDFYRLMFKQVMGLIFFDPNTPDIRACEKDLLNYHLPNLTKAKLDYELLVNDIAKITSEVYTTDEINWLNQFYSSPFGERMLKKQMLFNERLTREVATRYERLRPDLREVYGTVAQKCGGIKPTAPIDAPDIGSELLSVPGLGAAPIETSPQPGR